MAKTLFDLTYELARLLGTTVEGVATGGGTTSIADTVERTESDDFWNGGSAWILYDAGGAGAAPQGEYSFVSDFAQTGGIVTLRSTLTAAVAAGDKYALGGLRYPLQLLAAKINEQLGVIEKTDITTVVIAAEQTEYSLPTDCLELKQVWISSGEDDTNANNWQQLYDWYVQKSATGSANKLIFARQFGTGDLIKLVYIGYHTRLQSATDKLDDSINADKILKEAAVGCLLWYKAKVGDSDMSVNELLNYFQPLAAAAAQEFPQRLPKKSARTIHPTFGSR